MQPDVPSSERKDAVMGEALPDPAQHCVLRDGLAIIPVLAARPGRRQRSGREDKTLDHLADIDVSLESCEIRQCVL
jgi:hypothetical protein